MSDRELGALSADEQAREEATDPRRSILLQAPAGSGKTTVLTERVLRLLALVREPEEILAITFTRKAAAEMRSRVLKALQGEIDPGNPRAGKLRALAAAALERAEARGWNLARDPGRLRIQTIDSFNFYLASQLPVTAKAGGALMITDRPSELYRRAARRTLMSAEEDECTAADAELLFERLDNHWNNVETLLARMLEQRGHWLRYVLEHEPENLCERITESLAHVIGEQLSIALQLIGTALAAQAGALPDVGRLGAEAQTLGAWQRLARLCLIQKGEWRRSLTKSLGPAYEHPASREALKTCIELLSGIAGARQMLRELLQLPEATLDVNDTAAVEALSRLLRFAAGHLQAEFAAAGRVDHTYVGGAAREALTDAGLPTDLALRTGLSLRHLLVDEFQDTSLAQFDLLTALTLGWEPGDGRTLFIVGDPMQSIYQFREAEVGLFLRARDQGVGNVRLEVMQLTRNFRSEPGLIAWTNESFARLFPPEDNLRASAVAFTPSLAGRGEGANVLGVVPRPADASQPFPPVQLRLFPAGDRSLEARAVARHIGALRQHQADATVAVLVASRTHAVLVMAALEEVQLPAIGVDLVPLGDLSIVRDLVALTKALHHLGDRTAWLAVLRAPWCGVTLATLTTLSKRGDAELLIEAIAEEARLARCPARDRARLARVREVLNEALATRGATPLADWLEATWLRLGAADAYSPDQLRHAHAFLSALSERAASGEWRGPEDLSSLLEELYARPTGSGRNPVQVMTIHRAKGLEFDHVFLPSLDRDLGRSREPLLRWLDLPRAGGGSDLIMSPVPAIGEDTGGAVGAYIKRLMGRRSANEQARLLYVAVTRARQTLHLSGSPKVRADGTAQPRFATLLATLWPVLGPQFVVANEFAAGTVAADDLNRAAGVARVDVAADEARTAAAPALAVQPLSRLRDDWRPPQGVAPPDVERLPVSLQLRERLEFSWVQETFRIIGTVVHAALERLAAARPLPSSAAIQLQGKAYEQQLLRHGVPERDIQRAVSVVTAALTRILDDPRGRWILSDEHRDASSELTLTGLADGRLTNVIVDRSFIDRDGTRWVIDFKTSRHEGGGLETFLEHEMERYRGQLESYVSLARELGPEPVRAALYFPLLGVFRELT